MADTTTAAALAGTWATRLVAEKADLERRLDALTAFMIGPAFEQLPTADQHLLVEQRAVMRTYREVLAARVSRLTGPKPLPF